MSLNASGVRDTARVLRISTDTVLRELKKKEAALESVNTALLRTLNPDEIAVAIERAGAKPRWMRCGRLSGTKATHAGSGMRSITTRERSWRMSLGGVKTTVFLQLKALLEPFGLTHFYTDYWGAYTRHLDPEEHSPGKRNTQKIERKHLTLRTRIKRLVRKTICFSKSTQMHDIVIGLFVNRYAFGRPV